MRIEIHDKSEGTISQWMESMMNILGLSMMMETWHKCDTDGTIAGMMVMMVNDD